MIKKTSVKIISVLAVLIMIFTAVLLPAAAYDGGTEDISGAADEAGCSDTAPGNTADTENNAADITTAADTEAPDADKGADSPEDADGSGKSDNAGDDENGGGTDGENGEGTADDNAGASGGIFGEIYSYLVSHAGEIFSTLSFIGTVAVALAYRRGLIPLLRDGLGAIGGATNSISTGTEQARAVTEEAIAGVRKVLDGFSDALRTIERAGEETSERLRTLESEGYDKKTLTKILLEQINMLSDIFMSTSLPQFRKDEIAERAKEMRDLVAAVSGGTEEK